MASGLTRNQGTPLDNAEENDNFSLRAARGAANDAEKGGALACAAGGREGHGCDWHAAAGPELAEVVERWSAVPEAVRLAILALVRTAR